MQNVNPFDKRCFVYIALLIFSLHCNSLLAEQHTYSVGVVPQYDARQIFNTWNPILDYLSKATGNKFILANARDIPTFEQQLAAGKFDVAYANPFQFLEANKTQGYYPILRDGQRRLQGIVVTSSTGRFDTPASLHNQDIALPAPNALGASLLVRYEFKRLGIAIKPQYVKSHKSVYLQVASGRIHAGGGVQSTFDAQPAAIRNRLRIVYRTQALAPHPIIINPRVKRHDVEQIIKALLQLNQPRAGKAMLANIPMHKVVRSRIEDYANIANIDLSPFAQ